MACVITGKPANACCKFCGRLVSKEVAARHPYIMSVYIGANEVPKAIVVADAIWCGICRPQPEPIPMPDLY